MAGSAGVGSKSPQPTTNKPIKIGISAFIAERILPHRPDSEKFRESTVLRHMKSTGIIWSHRD
jgi:hypothetical protein